MINWIVTYRLTPSIRLLFRVMGMLLLVTNTLHAQQMPAYSQYTFNGFLLNPAVAGSEGYTAINVTSREQWIGIDGAPGTQSISIQTRIMKRNYVESDASARKRYMHVLRSGRVGLGAYAYHDRIGLSNQTGAQLTYAYHIAGAKSQFSMGLTLSVFQYRLRTDEMKLPDVTDKLINNEDLSMTIPDANVGVYYTNQSMYIGFSAFNLTRASIMFGNYRSTDFRMERQYNLIGGFKYDLNEVYTLEPSVYLKVSEQWKPQADLMLKLIYDRRFWLGAGYRYGNTAIGTVGVKLDRFYVGYSYDYSVNSLSYYSYGTHELMLALKLGDNTRRYRWMERY
ncbi:MAG TPA: type IX secretion system membrane protein PorP/SprF [Bacteroidales bacterium]|nr:type IX secretion system membrane protein PorP/SprF [Bacteroidales bacterium]